MGDRRGKGSFIPRARIGGLSRADIEPVHEVKSEVERLSTATHR
jgi:hypothetical protein